MNYDGLLIVLIKFVIIGRTFLSLLLSQCCLLFEDIPSCSSLFTFYFKKFLREFDLLCFVSCVFKCFERFKIFKLCISIFPYFSTVTHIILLLSFFCLDMMTNSVIQQSTDVNGHQAITQSDRQFVTEKL